MFKDGNFLHIFCTAREYMRSFLSLLTILYYVRSHRVSAIDSCLILHIYLQAVILKTYIQCQIKYAQFCLLYLNLPKSVSMFKEVKVSLLIFSYTYMDE